MSSPPLPADVSVIQTNHEVGFCKLPRPPARTVSVDSSNFSESFNHPSTRINFLGPARYNKSSNSDNAAARHFSHGLFRGTASEWFIIVGAPLARRGLRLVAFVFAPRNGSPCDMVDVPARLHNNYARERTCNDPFEGAPLRAVL